MARQDSMVFRVVSLILVVGTSAQLQAPAVKPLEEPRKGLYPSAPLHYVNIGSQLAGDYKFGYDTGKGPLGQSFREEVRRADGSVQGSYGVIDDLGHRRVVTYSSGRPGQVADVGGNFLSSRFGSVYSQPQSALQQTFDRLRQQLPLFKPSNYLQARVVGPSQYHGQNALVPQYSNVVPPPVDNIENRLPDPLLSDIVLPLQRTTFPEKYSVLRKPGVQYPSASRFAHQPLVSQYGAPKASYAEQVSAQRTAGGVQETVKNFDSRLSGFAQRDSGVGYEPPKASYAEPNEAGAQRAAEDLPSKESVTSYDSRLSRFAQRDSTAPKASYQEFRQSEGNSEKTFEVRPVQEAEKRPSTGLSRLARRDSFPIRYNKPKASFVEYQNKDTSPPPLEQRPTAAIQRPAENLPEYSLRVPVPRFSQPFSTPDYAPKASFVEYQEGTGVTRPVQDAANHHVTRRPGSPDKSSGAALNLKMSEIKRVTKRPSVKFPRVLDKAVAEEQSQAPSADVDYYDTVTPFIDIERLSYNIGSGKRSA